MKVKITGLFVMAMAAILFLAACSKDENPQGTSTLHVRLTDAPTALDSVFVDIREVRIKMSADSSNNDGWLTMNTNAGIYNLLELQNGVDTLLGTATVPTGNVRQLRFILGDSNRVVASGTSYPLTIPSGSESGLKINLNKQLTGGVDTLLIDFDAALSIRQEVDGSYKLRPVLQVR